MVVTAARSLVYNYSHERARTCFFVCFASESRSNEPSHCVKIIMEDTLDPL